MTMEHDDATDTHFGHSTPTAGDGTAAPDESPRFGPTFGLSAFQVAVIGLSLIIALAGVTATAPTAAGLSTPSPSLTSASTVPAAVEAAGSAGPTEYPEISGGFSRETYTGVAGDPVEIRHAFDNPDGPAYLLIGGNRLTDAGRSVGFVDVVKLNGGTTTINTRTIGTGATNVDSCANTTCNLEFRDENGNVVAENLSALSSATGAGGLARPLVPQRYRLAITNGTFVVDDSGVVTPTEVADQADLVLEKPTLHDEVEVFTSIDPTTLDEEPETESLAALRENGVERTAVTKGNRIVLGFESTGIWGALSHFVTENAAGPLEAGQTVDTEVLTDLLNEEEGVSLRVRQTNPGRNEPRSALDLSRADPEDVTLLVADATESETPDAPGRFYLVIDTSDGDHFTEPLEAGDEFAVEFALEGTTEQRYAFADDTEPPKAFEAADGVSGQFPYREAGDETVRAEASFTVAERYLRYDAVTDDGKIMVEAEDGRVTGMTSLLPVRELSATLVSDESDPLRTESPLEISDGNFTIDAGLDGVSPGTRLNYELYEGSTLRDSRTVVVVGDTNNPNRLVIDDAPENVTVMEDQNLSSIHVTARNAGGLDGEGELTLGVDNGSATGSWGVRLAPNESRTYGFGSVTADLDPGNYPFTLSLDDDTHNGTLVVEGDPAKTTLDDEGEAGTDDGTDTDRNGTDDGDSTDSSDTGDDSSSAGDENASESDGNSSDPDGELGGEAGDGESGGEDGDDGPATFLPFGIGTRETFGGTVLVGATYLLGHWV